MQKVIVTRDSSRVLAQQHWMHIILQSEYMPMIQYFVEEMQVQLSDTSLQNIIDGRHFVRVEVFDALCSIIRSCHNVRILEYVAKHVQDKMNSGVATVFFQEEAMKSKKAPIRKPTTKEAYSPDRLCDMTYLHYAALHKNEEAMHVLLSLGADMHCKCSTQRHAMSTNGPSPLQMYPKMKQIWRNTHHYGKKMLTKEYCNVQFCFC